MRQTYSRDKAVTILFRLLRLIGWVFIIWIISIVVIIGLNLLQGQTATQQHYVALYKQQLHLLAFYTDHVWLDNTLPIWVEQQTTKINHSILVKSGMINFINHLAQQSYQWLSKQSPLQRVVQRVIYHGLPFLKTVVIMTQLLIMRLIILGLAIPMFLLFGLVAITDGLMQRDLRKFGGGRESTFLFHRTKRWVVWFPTLGACLYLIIPLAISPGVFLLPFAIGFGYIVSIMMRTFKKYVYV